MANASFSPKNYRVAVKAESTHGSDAGITASVLYLDVDSIGFPSLNVTQAVDVKTGVGRILSETDFFQDNKAAVTEFSVSGTLHNDDGHKLLLQNIMNSTADPLAIAYNHSPNSGVYGTTTTANTTFSTYITSQDQTDGHNVVLEGCLCTNFAITSDMGTDGGKYTYSATIQTGRVAHLDNSSTPAGTAYSGAPITMAGLTSGSIRVYSLTPILSSFGVTIDSPAVFTGATSSGYEVASRASEIAVTVDAQVKYDGNTKGFISEFDTQTTANTAGNMFKMVNNNAYGVLVTSGLFTNVALSEGYLMMLDCSIKAVDDGSSDLITFDLSA